jgi:hypothetical protein
MDKSSSKLLQDILKYQNELIILDAYASLHTICGTALSLVFDLQVDVPKASFFSLPSS